MNLRQTFKLMFIAICGMAMVFSYLDAEAQCSMCKAILESSVDGNAKGPGSGINNGILYLLPLPYILIALVAIFIYRHNKKRARAQAS